jgi:uncharacterized protein YegJ (DUF2314 family)
MTFRQLAAAVALILAAGCDGGAAVENAESIYQVSEDDAEMNDAKRRAIAGLPQFYARLAGPAADESEFLVKFDIVPGDEAEFVWAGQLDRSSTPMTGVLMNQPELTDHQAGERVPIAEADIIDWSYRKGRVTQGGFTSRALLRHMSPEDAAEMRNHLGW